MMSGLDDELDELISDLAAPYVPNLPATPKRENENIKPRKHSAVENPNSFPNTTPKQQYKLTLSTSGGEKENKSDESEKSEEESNLNLMQLEEELRREREALEREMKIQEEKKKKQEELEIERQKIIQQRKEMEAMLDRKKLEQLKKEQEEKAFEEAKHNIQLREEKDHLKNHDVRKSVKATPSKSDKKTKKEDETGSSPPKSIVMIPQVEIKKSRSTPDRQLADRKDKPRKDSVDEISTSYSLPTTRACSVCGKQLMDSAKFCAMCGTPTVSLKSPRDKKKEKKEKKEKTGKDTSSSSDMDDKDRLTKMKVLEDIKTTDVQQRLRNNNDRTYKTILESEEQQKEKQFAHAREEMLQEIQEQKKKNTGRKFSIWGTSKEDKPDKESKHEKKSKEK